MERSETIMQQGLQMRGMWGNMFIRICIAWKKEAEIFRKLCFKGQHFLIM